MEARGITVEGDGFVADPAPPPPAEDAGDATQNEGGDEATPTTSDYAAVLIIAKPCVQEKYTLSDFPDPYDPELPGRFVVFTPAAPSEP